MARMPWILFIFLASHLLNGVNCNNASNVDEVDQGHDNLVRTLDFSLASYYVYVNCILSEFYMIGKVIPLLISQNIFTIGVKRFDDIDSRKKLSTRMFFNRYFLLLISIRF
jgi:hypothetical protein